MKVTHPKKAVVTIWSADGSETVLFVELEKYAKDPNDGTSYYVGTLGLDFNDPSKCTDEVAKGLVGRTVNIHLPAK